MIEQKLKATKDNGTPDLQLPRSHRTAKTSDK